MWLTQPTCLTTPILPALPPSVPPHPSSLLLSSLLVSRSPPPIHYPDPLTPSCSHHLNLLPLSPPSLHLISFPLPSLFLSVPRSYPPPDLTFMTPLRVLLTFCSASCGFFCYCMTNTRWKRLHHYLHMILFLHTYISSDVLTRYW